MATMLSSDYPKTAQNINTGVKEMSKYDPKNNEYINNYKREHYKCLRVEVTKEFYNDTLVPAAAEKGLPIAAYVREAISEKLERESNR